MQFSRFKPTESKGKTMATRRSLLLVVLGMTALNKIEIDIAPTNLKAEELKQIDEVNKSGCSGS